MDFFVGGWETPGVAGFTFSVDFAGGLEVWQAFKKIRSRQRKTGLFIMSGDCRGVPKFSRG
jgi:hypothetical protein